jgi:hypothetical protein
MTRGRPTRKTVMHERAVETTRRVELISHADRHVLEAFHLEIRRIARELGLEVTDVQIASVDEA